MPLNGHLSGRSVVRWGILGCGDVTEIKSGPGFQKAARCALVAVMRRDKAKAADYAKRHGVPRFYDNAEALIADSEVDAIYIATPPETHSSYALQVASAGKPAYVEKPMARNSLECDAMVEAFAKAHLPLYVAYYRRRLPRFLTAEDLIKKGVLGKVTSVDYRLASHPAGATSTGWRLEASLAGGGLFLDVGSHALDLLDYLFGPLSEVAGAASRFGSVNAVEDSVAVSFKTELGIPGTMTCNFVAAVREDRLKIAGTEGELSFSIFGSEPMRLETPKGVELLERPHPPHVQQPLIQTIVDDLLGLGTCPSTGESARRTSRVMDTVLSDYYGGRSDAFWTRPKTWASRVV